jgi:[histone H3]-lysine36 N-dimethyltransferase SETMAR
MMQQDACGIIFIEYLEKGQTINSTYYIALLYRFNDEIKKKRPHLKNKKLLFYQDNALCQQSIKATAKLYELGYELLPHPPYSPNPFFVCRPQKNEEVITETEAIFDDKIVL